VDGIQPWDRQPDESSRAYQAFLTYRDMGPGRSVRAVARELGKSGTLIGKWSSDHDWVSRISSWESMPSRALATAYEDMAREIAEQHRNLATKLMAKMERNLDLLPDGHDPTIRWSTAVGVAQRSHGMALDVSKPQDTVREEISKKITELIEKLSGE
jgi:hypothetical protein